MRSQAMVIEITFPGASGVSHGPSIRRPGTRAFYQSRRRSSLATGELGVSDARVYQLRRRAHRRLNPTETGPGTLTARQNTVMEHIACGETNSEIAAALSLGRETVKEHVRQILARLHARSRAHAVHILHLGPWSSSE